QLPLTDVARSVRRHGRRVGQSLENRVARPGDALLPPPWTFRHSPQEHIWPYGARGGRPGDADTDLAVKLGRRPSIRGDEHGPAAVEKAGQVVTAQPRVEDLGRAEDDQDCVGGVVEELFRIVERFGPGQ